MEGALDEIEAIGSRSGQMTGVPTGFTDLDSLTNGLHPGQMIVVAARPAMGKALALDTPLPTPSGWTTMGEVGVGDLLIGPDGVPTRVVAATEVMTGRPCYEITFDDGTTVVADADHQWLTESRQDLAVSGGSGPQGRQAPSVRTTKEIAETLLAVADGLPNHAVRTTAPLELPECALPVPPRELGARLACHKGPERIPPEYLRGSAAARRALLAGFLAAGGRWPGGTVAEEPVTGGTGAGGTGAGAAEAGRGAVTFVVAGRALAGDLCELLASLGHRYEVSETPARGAGSGEPGVSYGVTFTPDGPSVGPARRLITEVREVGSVPVRCVQVDNEAHLYLATRSMVPTHNSTLALDFARSCSIQYGLPSVFFSLEMGRNEIAMRLLSAEARVALHHMRSGNMTDDDWTRLARRMPEVSAGPLYIDDSPNLSMMEIRAKCRRLKQRNDLRLVVIDYLQLMTTGGSRRPESRQQEVSEMSRNLKLLAKELEVPVIALSQLNRGPEQRTDKKPMVSDLRESGSIEQDADMVILLHREDAYEKESPRAGEADLIVAKHRNGPTATITVAFQGHYSRFVDMAGNA